MENKNVKLASENELINKARKDKESFGVLYEFYFSKIYAYVFRRTGSREDAEDIVSEVFLKAFSNLEKYHDRGFAFGAWLYRLATNCLIDKNRWRGRHPEVLSGENLENCRFKENSDQEAGKSFDRRAIEKVLLKLSARHKKIICLRYFAEFEISEIAENMGISSNNVSVLLNRALAAFKRQSDKSGVKFFSFLL